MARWPVTLGVLLAGCLSSSRAPDAAAPFTPPPAGPCLALDSPLDLGEWPIGAVVVHFDVVNDTNSWVPIRAEAQPPFAGGVLVSPFFTQPSITLPPRNSATLEVSFAMTDSRLHLGTLRFNGGGPHCEDQLVELRVLGLGGLDAPARVEFPAIDAGAAVARMLPLTNTARSPMTVTTAMLEISVDAGALRGSFDVEPQFVIPALSSVEVPVTFRATGSGLVEQPLLLSAAPFPSRLVTLIAVAGVPRLDVTPARLALEALPLDSTFSWTFRTINTGDGVGRLRLSRVTGDATSPEGEVSSAREFGPEAVVFFTARDVGPRAWTLQFETNDPARPLVDVAVTGEVRSVPVCFLPLLSEPSFVTLDGGYPASVSVSLSNRHANPCLVKAEASPGLNVRLDDDQFFIDGGQTLPFHFMVNGPGDGFLSFTTSASEGIVEVHAF